MKKTEIDTPERCIQFMKGLRRSQENLRQIFKFYRRHFELIEKYHVSLKKLLQQGISNSELYRDLVYKFKKII